MLGKRIELTGQRADGTSVPVELSINRMPGEGPPLFAGFVRDISERKRQEALRAQHAAIVESSDDAIMAKTLQGVITSWNRGAERLFGYSAAETIGQPDADAVSRRAARRRDRHPQDDRARRERRSLRNRAESGRTGASIDVSVTISPDPE